MLKKILIAVLIAGVLAASTGCGTGSRSTASTHWNLGTPRTFSDSLQFEMKASLNNLTLKLDFDLQEGELIWVVIDPYGDEHHSGTLSGKESYRETFAFEPVVGIWTVAITADRVSGQVKMDWLGTK